MSQKQIYIYLTTNLINGKQYIGQHKGTPDDDYFGSGTTILRALKKYGKENFKKEILCYCESREEADEKEKYYIQKFDAVNNKNFYNNSEGGLGGDGWRSCQRWREQHPEEAKRLDQESGKRLQQWRIDNPEKFQQLVIKPFTEGAKRWRANNPNKVKAQMIKVNEGKKKWQQAHPDEHQKQVNRWRELGSITNSQQVICLTTGEVFPSQSAAGRYYNVPQPNISKCLSGERKSAGVHPKTGERLRWDYYSPNE